MTAKPVKGLPPDDIDGDHQMLYADWVKHLLDICHICVLCLLVWRMSTCILCKYSRLTVYVCYIQFLSVKFIAEDLHAMLDSTDFSLAYNVY